MTDLRTLRVFPRRTSMTPRDPMAYVGWPPLERPEADEVHISTVFTWDRPQAEYLARAWEQYYPVRLGGPAYGSPADDFIPGLYVRAGITFTSRGCNNQCPWCLVPDREGRLREIAIHPGNVINDNNLLQCNRSHIESVFAMLKAQKAIQFSGGLDARLLRDWQAEAIRGLKIKQVFLACDTKGAIKHLRRAINLLKMPRQKMRCYVLLAFNGETISEATERLIEVWQAGAMPSPQLYQPTDKRINYSHEWRTLQRIWTRPACTKALMKGKYES